MNERKALIIGAGIGGLTAAIALQRAGWTVRLLEQAPQLGEVGAGLTVGPSATRALESLGLGERLRAEADIPARASVLHYQTLERVVERGDTAARVGQGGKTWFHQMHRADFHRMLTEVVLAHDPDAVLLNSRLVGIEQDADSVTALLADGRREVGGLLVGADGLRSATRGLLIEEGPPNFTGQVAFRALVPMDAVPGVLGDFESATLMGPGAIFTRYKLRRGELVNCVGIVRTDSWTGTGWSHPVSRQEVLSHFAGWHPSVARLIEAAPADRMIKWALCDREPLENWTRGRVTLLGDAVHPVLPFLGMGAAMAIEDGVVLARALGATDRLDRALAIYEATRKPRASKTLQMARRQGELYQAKTTEEYIAASRPSGDAAFVNYDASVAPLADGL